MSRRFLRFFLFFILLALPARAQEWNFLDDEAEPGGYDVTARIASTPADFYLAKAENGDGYTFKLTATALQLWKISAKKPRLLAQSSLPSLKMPSAFVAQRRGPRWRFLIENKTVLEAEDDAFSEGQIGTRGGVLEVRVQPVESLRFDDDFMRVASSVALKDAIANPRAGVKIQGAQIEESIWVPALGRWATTGLTENAEAQVAQSANPFAFRPMNTGENLALAGRPFWSDYSAAASIQPQGAGEIGLLVYAQNPRNHLGLFWSEKTGPQLRAVVNGVAAVLDSAPDFGPFESKQWYRLQLQVAGGQLRGYIDDAEVLRARTGLFGRGQIGLYAQLPRAGDDAKAEGAVFDDVTARSLTDFYDDFQKAVPGRWATIAGAWNLQKAARPADTRGAYAVMGESTWSGYRVAGNLQVPPDGSTGLLLHHIAGKGAYLLRVSGSKAKGPHAAKTQIVLIQGNKTRVLGETVTKNRFDGSNLQWSFGGDDGYLSAKIGDELIVDAFDTSLAGGRAGIYAQNGATPALVTAFSVEFPTATSKWAKVPELYEVDQQAQTMGGWSTPQGFWIARSDGNTTPDPAVWHKGEFFGDEDIKLNLPDLSGGKTLKLMFAPKTGKRLTLTLSQKDALGVELTDGKKNWNGKAPLKAGAPLQIARRGTFVVVRSAATVILSARVA